MLPIRHVRLVSRGEAMARQGLFVTYRARFGACAIGDLHVCSSAVVALSLLCPALLVRPNPRAPTFTSLKSSSTRYYVPRDHLVRNSGCSMVERVKPGARWGYSMAERVNVGARGVGRTSVQHFSKSNAACRVALLDPKSCCQNSSKISLGNVRSFPYTIFSHADMAQLVEHHLAKVGVAGSSPVVRSM